MPAKNKVAISTATVHFVSYQTVRVRTENGEILKAKLKGLQDVLPGDQVEILSRFQGYRGRAAKVVEIISVQGLSEYQVVVQARHSGKFRSGKSKLAVVGLPLRGSVDCSGSKLKIQNGQYALISIARKRSKRTGYSAWRFVRLEQRLQSQREIAVNVARSRFGVRGEWCDSVYRELRKAPKNDSSIDLRQRSDLRYLPFVTIDPPTAKDHDDAVYCEKLSCGSYRLYVAIADVAHYVRHDSALDRAAYERGCSIYLPMTVVPMLPEYLSNDLCSLKANVDRMALVCEMVIDVTGNIQSFNFSESVIRSRAALQYFDIKDRLHADSSDEINRNLLNLSEVHRCLIEARTTRHALEFDLPATNLEFDRNESLSQISIQERLPAHGYVEESMLAANICAAEFIESNYDSGMFRVHGPPPRKGLHELQELLRPFGVNLPDFDKITSYSYLAILKQISARPQMLSALQIHLLRSLSIAVYSAKSGLHFALNYPIYSHFTSPIRRYPDLVVHRLIKAALKGENLNLNPERLEKVAKESSYLERRADACTREAEKWLKVQFMEKYVGQICDGVVVDVKKFGLFVQLEFPYVEGLVPAFDLGREHFYFQKHARQLIGRQSGFTYSIGMALRVRVSEVDIELGHINFELANGIDHYRKPKNRKRKRHKQS